MANFLPTPIQRKNFSGSSGAPEKAPEFGAQKVASDDASQWINGAAHDVGDWAGGALETAKGALVDMFSQDNANVPEVQDEWWKYSDSQQGAVDSATSDLQNSSQNAAATIGRAGEIASGEMAAAGRGAANALGDAGNMAVNVAQSGSQTQGELSNDAREASVSAMGESTKGIVLQPGNAQGAYDAQDVLRGKGSLGGVLKDFAGVDVTSGINSAADSISGAIEQARGTDTGAALAGFSSGAGPSRESLAGSDSLARFRPDYSGQAALGAARPGIEQLSDASMGGARGLATLGDRLLNYSGPSEAELQLDSALGKNVNAQFALANSGRGAYNGQALRQAQSTAASLGQEAAMQKAQLRAQEEAARHGLAASTYSSLGQLGSSQDATAQQTEQMRLEALQGYADVGVANSQQLLDAQTRAAAASQANDQQALAARDQELRAQIAAAQAAGQDASNLVALLNANTAAQQAAAQAELERMGILGQYSSQSDINDINRASALADVSHGLTETEIAAFNADQAARQGWFGQGLAALQAAGGMAAEGTGQQLTATGQNIDAVGQGQQISVNAQVQGMIQELGATVTAQGMIVDADGQILGSVVDWYTQEAERRAALEGTHMQAKASASATNANLDMQRDSSLVGMAGGLLGVMAL